MVKTVNIVSREKSDELEKQGFRLMRTETVGGRETYVFMETPELMRYLKTHFTAQVYYVSKKLNFDGSR